jgi:superfamily II DNA/RNA helicase
MNFTDIGISPAFAAKLAQRNIRTPTDIQKLVFQPVRSSENVLFQSATGTGKTFAYLLPVLENLLAASETAPPQMETFIIAPTLELCAQIKQEADFLLTGLPYKAALIIGSANISRQIDALKKEKPAIIIGNIARLVQLDQMGKLDLSNARTLVLDEADRLVSDDCLAGTEEFLGRISRAPRKARTSARRQIIACSATVLGKNRERLCSLLEKIGGIDQIRILETAAQELLREQINHWAFFGENRRKLQCLRSFLSASSAKKALVFTSRTGQVGNIVSDLQYHHIGADGLYSDMDKDARKRALATFKSGALKVLVSSDLASRGLDIPDINYVIALDVPFDTDLYVHRAGRTARAGKRGCMVTIGNEEELRRLSLLEKKLGLTIYPKVFYCGRIEAPPAIDKAEESL